MRAYELLNETSKNELYHVTHTKHVPNIQKNGLRPMGAASNWVQQGSGERYGAGEVYVFTNKEDANRWAGRMDWDFNQTIGSGEISIITLAGLEDHKFEKDEGDPMSQAGQQGDWLKTYIPILPKNIVKVETYNPKKLSEADELPRENYYFGNCTEDEVIDHLFGDVNEFARLVDEHGDEFEIGDLKVTYDRDADVHSFYMNESMQINEKSIKR